MECEYKPEPGSAPATRSAIPARATFTSTVAPQTAQPPGSEVSQGTPALLLSACRLATRNLIVEPAVPSHKMLEVTLGMPLFAPPRHRIRQRGFALIFRLAGRQPLGIATLKVLNVVRSRSSRAMTRSAGVPSSPSEISARTLLAIAFMGPLGSVAGLSRCVVAAATFWVGSQTTSLPSASVDGNRAANEVAIVLCSRSPVTTKRIRFRRSPPVIAHDPVVSIQLAETELR